MRAVITFFAVLGLDWGTKYWAEKKLPLNRKKEIVRDRLYFRHIKNGGMAYHKFDGKRNGILAFTGVLLSAKISDSGPGSSGDCALSCHV